MADFAAKQLQKLFEKYHESTRLAKPSEEIELEIRFRDITREAFESIYNYLRSSAEFDNPRLECSVNIISDNMFERNSADSSYIRKIIFDRGVNASDTYLQKTRLIRPVHIADYIKYSVGLSRESPCRKFSTTASATIRFKARVSFDYIGPAPAQPARWRFDLTAIRQAKLSEMGNNLKKPRQEMFGDALTASDFLRELNYDVITAFEVEIEYIGSPADLINEDLYIAHKVFTMINPQYIIEIAYQEEIYHIAKLILTNQNILPLFKQQSHRLKQLGNQVIALSKNTYYSDVYPTTGYYLTIKADGVRAIISINGNRCRIMRSDTMIEIPFKNGTAFIPGKITVADAELVYLGGKTSTDSLYTLYLFDVMVIDDNNISKSDFATRSAYLDSAAEIVTQLITHTSNKCEAKKFARVEATQAGPAESAFREIWEAKYPFPVDGLIITEPGQAYRETKNYKWKPYDHNTIDFLAVKCPQKMLGIKPYEVRKGATIYLLFVGINRNMREKLGLGLIPQYRTLFTDTLGEYYPVQFSPSPNPLAYIYYHDSALPEIDRQIVELSRNEENTQWIFHGVRTDRRLEKNYYGNDYLVAELTYLNYIDPFDFEGLWQPSESYFTKTAGDIHTAPNKFKRFVISVLLKDNLSRAKWVIDEAAGRGADLHRYQEIGVENTLFTDIDATAIAELVRRKFTFFAAKKRRMQHWTKGPGNRGRVGAGIDVANPAASSVVVNYDKIHDIEYEKLIVKDVKSLTVHTLVADLKTPANELIASTYQFGINPGAVDGIVCNFAFHYLCDTIEHIRNILSFNSRMLRVGGLFIFTVMDGAAVFELLKDVPTRGQWESREDGVLKYALKKQYTGAKLTAAGQMISVLLPFSDQMYDEPLCNIDVVIREAGRVGFGVELNAPMTTFMDKFTETDRALADRLTAEDKKYIGLFKYVSLRKIREMK